MSELKSAKFIIDNTPVGFIQEIDDNLKSLNSHLEESKEFKDLIKSYEEDHFKQVPLGEDKLILSKFNKDDQGYYYDQSKKYKLLINPLSENFEKLEKITQNYPLQVLLDKKVNEYKEKYYTKDKTSHNVYYEEKDTKWNVKVLLSSHHIELKNYQTGEWISCYVISPKEQGEYSIEGSITINTFYNEENNTQFHLEEKVSDTIKAANDEELWDKIIEIIESKENKIQIDLTEAFDSFEEEYTKPLRRKLPMTGMKMNWSLNQLALK